MTNSVSQLYFRTAIVLLIVGMAFGIYMAASQDHIASPAHAHLNLIGFVVMSVYGTYFALNPAKAGGRMPRLIWGLNTLAAVVMFPTLAAVLYGKPEVEPLVALASLMALVGAVMFAVLAFRPTRA